MIVIEGDVINNMQEAAEWLREAWIYEPYNISYFNIKGYECIDIEPVRGHDDTGWTVESLEEFKSLVESY